MATSFSTIKNRPPNSTKKIQVIEKVIEKLESGIITHYGPYPYGVTNDRQDTVFIDTPMYMLINLIDKIGIYQTLQFDTLRMYITNLNNNTSVKIQFGIFRLKDNATFGDYNSYNNNSELVGNPSEILEVKGTDGPKGDGRGFFDVRWKYPINLPLCIGDKEQRYFLTFLLCDATSNIQLLTGGTNWRTGDLENYCYNDLNTVTSFPATMGLPKPDSNVNAGFFPYYTMYKRHDGT